MKGTARVTYSKTGKVETISFVSLVVTETFVLIETGTGFSKFYKGDSNVKDIAISLDISNFIP